MYVYLQIFFKDLEFSDCKRPTLTIFFPLFSLSLNVLEADMH